MKSIVVCPNCGHQFSPDEIVSHELEVELRAKFEKETAKVLADRDAQIQELIEKAKAASAAELQLLKEKRELKEAQENFQLEKERAINAERDKIREDVAKAILEKEKYKLEEYEKKIKDMQKALEDAQRKGSQGSQQLQGEIQELDLESTLRTLYPFDLIEEVKKGETGGDIRQTVRTEMGTICGKILWESKRTKAWSDGWLGKLKEDMRRDQAHLCAIISEIMPSGEKDSICCRQGVWILSRSSLGPLSALLRKNLIDVAREKHVAAHKQTTAESLYDYVTSPAFNQNMERIVRIYLDMKTQIAKESAAAERGFKQRNMQVDMLLSGISGIYGEMQGIAGSSLPAITLLESGD